MDKTQKTALKKDIYLSAFPKMLNEIRVRVSRDGRNIENLTDKRAYFAIFRDLFIDIKSQDYFSLYGQPSLFRSTEEILTSHATRLKQLWQERHQLLGLALSEEKLQLLDHDLKTIIRDTMKYVDEVYLSDNSERFGEQVQVKVEQLTQIELQVQQVIEVSEQKLRAVDYVPWKSLPQRNANKVLRLNAFLAEDKLDFGPIYLSQNFYRCFEQQKPEIDEYLKPVFVLMFRQTRPHVFEAFLLTQQEAHELEPMIAKNSGVWLTTTNHSVLAGQAPPGIQQSKLYQSMMEVAQFINADLSLLLAHTGEFSWLDREKIKFFRERLQTIRIADDAMLQTLEQKLEHQDLRTPFHSLQAPLSASWFIAACAGMAGIVGGALLVVGLISSQEILLALGIVCMAFSSVYLALTMFKPKEQHKFEAPCVSIQLFKDR